MNVNVYSGCVIVGRLHFLIDCLVNPTHPLFLFLILLFVFLLLLVFIFLFFILFLPSFAIGPFGADNDTALAVMTAMAVMVSVN